MTCMPFSLQSVRRVLTLLGLGGVCGLAAAQNLPPAVEAAMLRANLPRDAVTLLVVDAEGRQAPRLSHRASVPVNPASVMKLVTTSAALELLGPNYKDAGLRRYAVVRLSQAEDEDLQLYLLQLVQVCRVGTFLIQ